MPLRKPDAVKAFGFRRLRQGEGLVKRFTLRPILAVVAFHHQADVYHASPPYPSQNPSALPETAWLAPWFSYNQLSMVVNRLRILSHNPSESKTCSALFLKFPSSLHP
jgi:hypothetical protein